MSTALRDLERKYGINPKEVPILDGEPWLTSNQLAMIARKEGGFSLIDVDFKEHVSGLEQVIWRATVTVSDGRVYCRSGVATIGEKLPGGAKASEHDLAASRALRSALAMAGFDVLKSGSPMTLKPGRIEMIEDAPSGPASRLSQLRQIHILAEQLGLIKRAAGGRDDSEYKAFLLEHYGTESTAGMTEEQRASVINALSLMKREYEAL